MEPKRRPASDSDKSFLREANRRAYEDLVVRQFGVWDEEAQGRYFDEKWEHADFEVVEVAGERVGAIWTSDEGDFLRLRDVYLLPEWQGQGIGSALVRQELASARRLSKPLRLSALRENRARDLYERLGFAVIAEDDVRVWMEAGPTPC